MTPIAPASLTSRPPSMMFGPHFVPGGFGSFQTYAVPGCGNGDCVAVGMATGINQRVWFANGNAGSIGSVDAAAKFRIHDVDNVSNYDIAEGSDWTMWFTGYDVVNLQGWVGHYVHGSVSMYPVPFQPLFIARGLHEMWFGGSNHISRISSTGVLQTFLLDSHSNVEGITKGPDGGMWFTDEYLGSTIQSRIGKIMPSGRVKEFVVPDNPPGGVIGIAAGPDGNLWFTDGSVTDGITTIGRCTTGGSIRLYRTPTRSAGAWGIVQGPSDDLYFTETRVGKIGRVTLNPVTIAEYKVPLAGANPLGIALGADGNIWFTVPGAGVIGTFDTH